VGQGFSPAIPGPDMSVSYTASVRDPSQQLDLPLLAPPPGVEEYLPGRRGPLPVQFVRHPRARRYLLRINTQGVARVTMPRWGRRAEARAFAEAHVAWIEHQRARQLQRAEATRRLAPGELVLFHGIACPLTVHAGDVITRVSLGELSSEVPTPADLDGAVRAMLRERAARELPTRLRTLADGYGLAVLRVTIRDQHTRWGSCSTRGRISLNWRLVQMPESVCDYVLVHELMHLRVANHSRTFWRQVAAACPEYELARAWLRRHGRELL
jgi:predicted metal-dependent hydrolase